MLRLGTAALAVIGTAEARRQSEKKVIVDPYESDDFDIRPIIIGVGQVYYGFIEGLGFEKTPEDCLT